MASVVDKWISSNVEWYWQRHLSQCHFVQQKSLRGTDLKSKPGFHAERSATNRLCQGTDRVSERRNRRSSVGTSLTGWNSALQLSLVTPNTLSGALFDNVTKAATWRRCVKLHAQRAEWPQSDTFAANILWLNVDSQRGIRVNSRSAHGQLTVNSRSAHGQLTVSSRSTHGQLTVSSRSGEKNSLEFWGLYNSFVGHSGPKYAAQ